MATFGAVNWEYTALSRAWMAHDASTSCRSAEQRLLENVHFHPFAYPFHNGKPLGLRVVVRGEQQWSMAKSCATSAWRPCAVWDDLSV